jgi:hypothetical protein
MPTKKGSDSPALEQKTEGVEPAAEGADHAGTGWAAHSCYDDAAARMKLREVPMGAPNEGCVYTGKAFQPSLSFTIRPSG